MIGLPSIQHAIKTLKLLFHSTTIMGIATWGQTVLKLLSEQVDLNIMMGGAGGILSM